MEWTEIYICIVLAVFAIWLFWVVGGFSAADAPSYSHYNTPEDVDTGD